MSIHSAVNMANFVGYDEKPEWMRAERYEYCECYESMKERTGWLERIISFLK